MSEKSSENPESSSEGSKSDPKKEQPAKFKLPPSKKPGKEASTTEAPEGEAHAALPIRPRGSVAKTRDAVVEEGAPEEEGQEKEKAPARMKPSGKPYSIHKSRPKPEAEKSVREDEASDDEKEVEEAASESDAADVKPALKQASDRKRPSAWRWLFRLRVPLVPALLVLVGLTVVVGYNYYGDGIVEGKRQAELALIKDVPPLPPELTKRLDAAAADLRSGRADEALKTLTDIEATTTYPSITFLVGLAALQNGDVDLVEEKAKASIKKREKVSDSLALLAVVESQRANDKTRLKLGSSIKRSEGLLAQAIAADPANPYPRFELATLLRYDRRKEEAAVQLQGARNLLNPIDSHSIMDITTKVMAIEAMPLDQVPTKSEPSDNPQKLIPDAYAAMRIGDFARAATLLRAARDVLSQESFDYLVNDPAMRRYAREAALAEFYAN